MKLRNNNALFDSFYYRLVNLSLKLLERGNRNLCNWHCTDMITWRWKLVTSNQAFCFIWYCRWISIWNINYVYLAILKLIRIESSWLLAVVNFCVLFVCAVLVIWFFWLRGQRNAWTLRVLSLLSIYLSAWYMGDGLPQ